MYIVFSRCLNVCVAEMNPSLGKLQLQTPIPIKDIIVDFVQIESSHPFASWQFLSISRTVATSAGFAELSHHSCLSCYPVSLLGPFPASLHLSPKTLAVKDQMVSVAAAQSVILSSGKAAFSNNKRMDKAGFGLQDAVSQHLPRVTF